MTPQAGFEKAKRKKAGAAKWRQRWPFNLILRRMGGGPFGLRTNPQLGTGKALVSIVSQGINVGPTVGKIPPYWTRTGLRVCLPRLIVCSSVARDSCFIDTHYIWQLCTTLS